MNTYYDFEVYLLDIEPRIWRRFLLKTTSTFNQLHLAIQDYCGWENYHLYEFRESRFSRKRMAISQYEEPLQYADEPEENIPPGTKLRLNKYFLDYFPKNALYVYDFGDYWEHQIICHGIVKSDEKFTRKLIDGGRAFPHEDSGSTPGYEECVVAALYRKNPALNLDALGYDPEEIESRLYWMGDWDPDDFDLEKLKKMFDR